MAPEQKPSRPSRWWYLFFLLVVAGVVYALLSGKERTIDFSEFRRMLAQGRIVDTVLVGENVVRGTLTDGETKVAFKTVPPPNTDLAPLLQDKVEYTGTGGNEFLSWLPWLLIPIFALVLIWLLALRGQGGAHLSALQFGRHRARIHAEKDTLVNFADVAGVDEAVEEVREVVQYLQAPERFQALGGRVPKGVLLVGMPGTGKTLLARAVAGEASVPFLSISGTDFVEMFVGVGASRVRDLFARAKEMTPCIIFIDEIDALGKARGAGSTGGSEEREQTLNQLLVEMDGFQPNSGVILLAATNRPEVLDQALLRAGRFDRQVVVDRPDVRGRLEILRLHTRYITLGRNVDLAVVARRTPGFTGADLATLVNEGALLAARRGRDQVGMAHIEEAIDRVMAGLERRSRLIGPREKMVVAVHETGHAIAACLLPHADPLHKVSVIPRGAGVGGMTLQLPREDKTLLTRAELLDRIAVLLAGRTAEQVIFNVVSTGAANDLLRVAEVAYRMVVEYGMSERLGPIHLGDAKGPKFLRGDSGERALGDETTREIDLEVRAIVAEQEERVRNLLEARKRHLAALARMLRDKETLDAGTFRKLLATPLRRRKGGGVHP
ncbi:MAG: ATP-dependent zinc metalloprotease FtsH [Planctomycetota bacterium]|jgi:cell division protease FtsH